MIDLDAIEARYAGTNSDGSCRSQEQIDCAPGDVRALIAEVRTLRAQVEARPDISPELAARYLGNQMSITSYVRMTEMELQRKLREHARKVKL